MGNLEIQSKKIYLVKNLIAEILSDDELSSLKKDHTPMRLFHNRVNEPEYGFFVKIIYSSSSVIANIVYEVPLDTNLNPLTTCNNDNCLYIFIPGDSTTYSNKHSQLSFGTKDKKLLSRDISMTVNSNWIYAQEENNKTIDLNNVIQSKNLPICENERIFTIKLSTAPDTSITTGSTNAFSPFSEATSWFYSHKKIDYSEIELGQLSFTNAEFAKSKYLPYTHQPNKGNEEPTYYLVIPENSLVVDGSFNIMSLSAQVNKISDTTPYIICCSRKKMDHTPQHYNNKANDYFYSSRDYR